MEYLSHSWGGSAIGFLGSTFLCRPPMFRLGVQYGILRETKSLLASGSQREGIIGWY